MSRPLVLLRPLPGSSAIHELWAGTKLVTVVLIAVLLTVLPGWPSLALVAVLVTAAARVAGVPWGALPSVPRWLWWFLVVTGAVAAIGGGVAGLLSHLQLIVFALVMFGVCAMVSWTTHVSEIAPAVAVLGKPLRMFRIPVDDWAVTLALALRIFPMLLDELRMIGAARRLRPQRGSVVDLLGTAMSAALRRANEMGDAITTRGGAGQISAMRSRPRVADALTFTVVVATVIIAVALQI